MADPSSREPRSGRLRTGSLGAGSLRAVPLKAMITAALVLLSAPLVLSGCAADEPEVQAPKRGPLPKWQGQLRDLYPNEIDPSALGFGVAETNVKGAPTKWHNDRVLWARSTSADIVGRVRIQTVTVDTRKGTDTYRLGVQFATPTLSTPTFDDYATVELTVSPSDSAYGMVKALDTRMQGKTFVAFVKRFAGPDDEIEVHFYLSPDSSEVAKAVQEAVAVEEVSKH